MRRETEEKKGQRERRMKFCWKTQTDELQYECLHVFDSSFQSDVVQSVGSL